VSIFTRVRRWWNPPATREQQDQDDRIRNRQAMIRGSQDSVYYSESNLPPPTPTVTEPRR